jgi:hypothetical protein
MPIPSQRLMLMPAALSMSAWLVKKPADHQADVEQLGGRRGGAGAGAGGLAVAHRTLLSAVR